MIVEVITYIVVFLCIAGLSYAFRGCIHDEFTPYDKKEELLKKPKERENKTI